ncbi:MAG: hypothetical protein IPI69_11795 [Bacteroidales bacterium]|nr:hypothetical protein [Bacteroidales bacterium]
MADHHLTFLFRIASNGYVYETFGIYEALPCQVTSDLDTDETLDNPPMPNVLYTMLAVDSFFIHPCHFSFSISRDLSNNRMIHILSLGKSPFHQSSTERN